MYNGFDTGTVNATKVFYKQKDDTRDDAVIVRVYKDGLGDANPRETEFQAMQIAHAAAASLPYRSQMALCINTLKG